MTGSKSVDSTDRTIELIVYISSKLGERANYGATLLGKALCLIDSVSYLKTGQPISDLSYIKQERGPTPNPNKFLPLRDFLVSNGDLEKIDVNYFGFLQNKFISKREPRIKVFTKDEIFLIDEVLSSISDQNASEISEYTHNFLAWIFANNKEELPFYSFLLTTADLNAKDFEWAKKSIKTYKSYVKNAS
jgi:hypothetical protein